MSSCPYCGWPDEDPVQDLSLHRTGEGAVVWTRCGCGSLQARVITSGTLTIVARSRPAATD